MFNYLCLRLNRFKGDVIGTDFFHSVLLISVGLSFCDSTSRLISTRFQDGKIELFPAVFRSLCER